MLGVGIALDVPMGCSTDIQAVFGVKLGRSIRDTDAPLGMQLGAIMQG